MSDGQALAIGVVLIFIIGIARIAMGVYFHSRDRRLYIETMAALRKIEADHPTPTEDR
jgi:hypothetical protein